jgi:hypothetical protein
MIDICKRILGDENRGATHFVSSIDLGAKLYYKETVSEKEQTSKVSANAALGGDNLVQADAGISRSKEATRKVLRSDTVALIHHAVDMNETKTEVSHDREMVIACKISPVWLLVREKTWRQAMKTACEKYVKENNTEYNDATVAAGGPFLISCGKYYLRVKQKDSAYVLTATDQCRDASDMFIDVPRIMGALPDQAAKTKDPLQDPHSYFYIYHTDDRRSGTRRYLCAHPDNSGTVILATRIPSPNAYSRLYVEFSSTQCLAPVSRWSKEPMHLLRKTAYRRRPQYIVLRTDAEAERPQVRDENLMLVSTRRKESVELVFTSDHPLQSLCQFTIRNADIKCIVDSDGNKKECSHCRKALSYR